MDFGALAGKLAKLGDQALTASSGAFEKAGKITGDLLEKTAEFTYDKVKTTPLCIQSTAELDSALEVKNSVIFVVGAKEDALSKSMIGRLPLLAGKAWQYSASLKVMFAADYPEQVIALGASIPSALIYRSGVQKHVLTEDKLIVFLESFDLSRDWSLPLETPTTVAPTPKL